MKSNKTISIAFEGLHRSGKGTQIQKLNKLLKQYGKTINLRGAGSRNGIGSNNQYYDPYSLFWQAFSCFKYSNPEIWGIGAYQINQECIDFETFLNPNYIILDRCYLSNNFLLKKLNLAPLNYTYKPDLIFILNCSYQSLISRANNDVSSKKEFRIRNIEENYVDYMNYINEFQYNSNIIHINGNYTEQKIHNLIRNKIWERIYSPSETQY